MSEAKGQGGRTPLQILADQLTLSQPEGADYAPSPPTLLLAPTDFQTFRHP